MRKYKKFEFGEQQRLAFLKLKVLLSNDSVLHIYRQGFEIKLPTDASKVGYGRCLLQYCINHGKFYSVYYISKKITLAEKRYSSYDFSYYPSSKKI